MHALTQHDLDDMPCATPGCTHDDCTKVFVARCHPRAPLRVAYIVSEGVLHLTCTTCDRVVADVEVTP